MTLIITLLALGSILMFLESFLHGRITGTIGFLCWVGAVILGYRDFGFQRGNLILGAVLVGLMIGVFCRLNFFPKGHFAGLFIPRPTVGELGAVKPELLHRSGVAITQLRPSGAAFINGKRVDVITEGALIDQGASVQVVAVRGMRVVVREL
jgi:membrane-bound serine protease (ClpP class)